MEEKSGNQEKGQAGSRKKGANGRIHKLQNARMRGRVRAYESQWEALRKFKIRQLKRQIRERKQEAELLTKLLSAYRDNQAHQV